MLGFTDYSIILVYLAFIIILGLFLEKKASNNGQSSFFLAIQKKKGKEGETTEKKHLPWWMLGASGMASNTDLAGTMIISALIYALGTKGFFIEIRGGIVLVMAFFMIFMGKWNRRANEKDEVITLAQWMELRFGKGQQGKIARLISAISMLVFSIGAMSYFAVAGGKFLGQFFGVSDQIASIILLLFVLIYTVISGFYGVVVTDVFQGFLIFVAVIYICTIAFQTVTLPETFSVGISGTEELTTWSFQEWSNMFPSLTVDLPGDYQIFNLFGGVVLFYLIKTIIEGYSGSGGYMLQRYLAAKSDRDAGLLSLFWIVLMAFRWPLVTAFALLGIHYGFNHEIISDPELILPTVIAEYIPTGIRGLLIACFLAAAMSTFDSIINAGASYWVVDIYATRVNPLSRPLEQLSPAEQQDYDQKLIKQARLSSVAIVVIGLLFSLNLTNINEIWGWLTLGLGVGLAIPLLLRWYWWRFNGYGFAIGTGAGMVAAIVTKAVILPNYNNPQLQEYILFLVPGICSLAGCIIGTILTKPTERKVLEHFYQVTRPFGFWADIPKSLARNEQLKIKQENKRDILSTLIAVPWQLTLFLLGIMLMMKSWDNLKILVLIFLLLSIALYFTWFRYLNEEKKEPQTAEYIAPKS